MVVNKACLLVFGFGGNLRVGKFVPTKECPQVYVRPDIIALNIKEDKRHIIYDAYQIKMLMSEFVQNQLKWYGLGPCRYNWLKDILIPIPSLADQKAEMEQDSKDSLTIAQQELFEQQKDFIDKMHRREALGINYPFITDAPTSDFDQETTHNYITGMKDVFKQSIIITKDIVIGSDYYNDILIQPKVSRVYVLDSKTYVPTDHELEKHEVSTIINRLK